MLSYSSYPYYHIFLANILITRLLRDGVLIENFPFYLEKRIDIQVPNMLNKEVLIVILIVKSGWG